MSLLATVQAGRRFAARTMLDRCDLLTAAHVPDGSGGTTTTYTTWQAAVPCRFADLDETDLRLVAGTTMGPASAALLVSVDLIVPEGTLVRHWDPDGTWVVVGDRTPPSALAMVRRLLIREATWGA